MNSCLFFTTILIYLGVLLSVAYFTLMERKCLSSLGIRLGPDKISLGGLAQPISDGMKLFTKEFVPPSNSAKIVFFLVPCVSLLLCFLGWQIFPCNSVSPGMGNDILFFLVVSSVNAHIAIMSGWSSSSKYASVGGVRGFAQVISYEICLSITLVAVMFFSGGMSFFSLSDSGWSSWWSLYCLPVAALWVTICLAEANRAPFDLVEAESELVSGFNTEFSAGSFAGLFIAEYGMILLMCLVTVWSFFQNACTWTVLGSVWMFMKVGIFAFFFIWTRATFPRFRYDQLMMAAWKSLLPFILGIYCVFFFITKF
uniref:NADH-ubiquinone oxidoreductase chain 1 n=1 Tax=Magallana hongkongensis TaxID=2653900 RepID=B6RQ82_MAGHO|nr:NADH dehydrogenase subunit 1 [Crassostrea hongkongensis]ABY26716.1 NADH dehydrogenase subunit 1 [Crassostrea hongkongensis]ACD35457.1 NADH dehydrogenase subunit 1 [Crassostrea hongkongensis]ACL80185.1 NADH dehydrogenase subunit 1 [Crassostrea hongkongensis]ACL80197.1 NADH dehydrogenase subunit 1 [Crassostrea hongkongensis]ACO40177.1 NADH dehydrogenase subunit 1 [Crassostrea hongkongensis]